MKALFSLLILLTAVNGQGETTTIWELKSATLTWHVPHPVHTSEGKSTSAKGKAICKASICELLVAAPIKSFDSENENRDAHVRKILKAELHPMVMVRAPHINFSQLTQGTVTLPVEVELAGQVVHLKDVAFKVNMSDKESMQVSGRLNLSFDQIKVERPALLAVPVSNDFYILVDTTWHTSLK